MTKLSKTLAIALTGLGLAFGSALATAGDAEARPGRGGGIHRGGIHHGGHFRHGHWGHRHWRHARWGLGGPMLVSGVYGPRCRLVERLNPYGEIVVRRICRY